MDKQKLIKQNIEDSVALKSRILSDESTISRISNLADRIIQCYQSKGKVLFCGNGGSAADAQHLSAELSGRYYYNRPPLYAEALHVNPAYMTAVANDFSYSEIYARLIEASGNSGDILIGLSTSGNSDNIVRALQVAKNKNMTTVGLSGESGGEMAKYCDILVTIPSTDTPRIQECHMVIGHAVCQIVELALFPQC